MTNRNSRYDKLFIERNKYKTLICEDLYFSGQYKLNNLEIISPSSDILEEGYF